MKTLGVKASLQLLVVVSASAWHLECAHSCLPWSNTSICTSSSGWACLCQNSTALSNFNSCVDKSTCSATEKETIDGIVAQGCRNHGITVTQGPEATATLSSFASGASQYGGPWVHNWESSGYGPWSGHPGPGGGPGPGWGPFGPSAGGWGPWGSSGPWTTGPWTSWWGNRGECPPSTWSGWTHGPWGTAAPWTTWPGCTATTTATSVVTSTDGAGIAYTSTAYAIQVAAVTPATSASEGASMSATLPATTSSQTSGAMPAQLRSSAGWAARIALVVVAFTL